MTQEPSHSSADAHSEDADRPPLGQILVESGLLDARDLERVLEEQRRSGVALGRLLVDGGYVSGPSMALALARQQGTLLKTEYGFGVPQTPLDTSDGPGLAPMLNVPDDSEPEPMPALRTVGLAPIRLAPQPETIEDEPLRLTEPIAPAAPAAPAEAHAELSQATEEREKALQDRIDELTAEQSLSLEQSRVDRRRLEELSEATAALEQERERLLAEASSLAADDQALTEARHDYAALREATEEREQALQARIDELTAEQERLSEELRVDRAQVEQLELRLATGDEALTEARRDYAALRGTTEEREQALQARIDELTVEQERLTEELRVDRAHVEELELRLTTDDEALTEARYDYASLREAAGEREQALQGRIDELTAEQARSSEQMRVDRAHVEELELRLAAGDEGLTEARHDYAALSEAAEEREHALQSRIDELTAEQERSSEQTRADRGRMEELEHLLAEANSSVTDDEALAQARRDYAALRHATEEREKVLQDRIDELTAEQEQSSEQTRVDQARLEELELRLGVAERQVATASEALSEAREAYAALRHSAEERETALRARIDELTAETAAEAEGTTDTRRYADDWHTLFLSTPGGYQLVEQDGPAPTPGAVLNLPDGAGEYRVLRLGPSPLPGDGHRCAYLEELLPAQA